MFKTCDFVYESHSLSKTKQRNKDECAQLSATMTEVV